MWGDSDEDGDPYGDPYADDSYKDSDDMSSCTYEDHHRKAPTMLGVEAMWKEGALVDYTIEIDNQQFHVHKVILASMCDYFRVMFSSGMKESEANKINLTKSVSATAMETLIEYIYTNKLDIDEDNARELLKAAMYLQIEEAIKKCTKFISDWVDSDSCLEVFAIFKSCNIESGIKATNEYIISSFERVLNKHPASEISHEELLVLIDLWQQSEKQLFDLIVSWINCDPDERKKYWEELLPHVRFCVMPPSDLEKISDLLKEGKEIVTGQWCGLIDEAKKYHSLPVHKKVSDDSTQTQVRKPPNLCAFSRGLQESPGFYNELDAYDFGKWKSDASLELPGVCRRAYAQVKVNNFLIVCVDSDGAQRWFIFNPRTSEWSGMAGMPTEREGFALVHHGGYLYAIGGALLQEDGAVTDIIEKYDISNNTWSTFSKLPVAVRDHGACFLGDVLYVSGGRETSPGPKEVDDPTDENYPGLARVDCFDLSNQTWQSKAPMLKSHGKHLMHVMKIGDGDLIYVIDRAAKIERYYPTSNAWRKYSYSVTHKLPRLYPEYIMVAEGNRLLLIDVNVHAFYDNEPNGAVLIRFPKERWVTQATNVFRPHFPFNRKSKKHMRAHDEEYPFPVCALLCFPPKA